MKDIEHRPLAKSTEKRIPKEYNARQSLAPALQHSPDEDAKDGRREGKNKEDMGNAE